MSTHPLRRGCSLAQTFPLFHVRGRSARSPTAQASRSTPFVECKFDEWKHYRRTVSFTRACVPFKNTGHIIQGNERDTATCAVSLSCRKCDTAMPSESGTNYGKTAGKRPEKMHIRRSKQIRHKGEHDLQGRTHPRTDGNRRPDNDAHSARIPPITKETAVIQRFLIQKSSPDGNRTHIVRTGILNSIH